MARHDARYGGGAGDACLVHRRLAIAVWSALLAALCLALRRAWAVWLFALSLLGLVVNMVYAFAFADVDAAPGEIMFTVILILIGLFELIYAQAMQKRGVLR